MGPMSATLAAAFKRPLERWPQDGSEVGTT